jgi:hypothetical protein
MFSLDKVKIKRYFFTEFCAIYFYCEKDKTRYELIPAEGINLFEFSIDAEVSLKGCIGSRGFTNYFIVTQVDLVQS